MPDSTAHRLFQLLADGRQHSGADLAEALGISRSAVWKHIETLRNLGLEVEGIAGGGYQLEFAIDCLDAGLISAELANPPTNPARHLVVQTDFIVDSTNTRLARRRAQPEPIDVLLAEAQSAGRGRRGRAWLSPPGCGIYLSLHHRFDAGLVGLGALSLVVGLSTAEAIESHTGIRPGLKWPNDLLIDGRKLGGCLVDISGTAEGPCDAVIGVGINWHFPARSNPGQAWTDLHQHDAAGQRNSLAAAMISAIHQASLEFNQHGFEPFSARWQRLDALDQRPVRIVRSGNEDLLGQAVGVDVTGRLRLQQGSDIQMISAGEVSLREC